jgi:hypothetical protein
MFAHSSHAEGPIRMKLLSCLNTRIFGICFILFHWIKYIDFSKKSSVTLLMWDVLFSSSLGSYVQFFLLLKQIPPYMTL